MANYIAASVESIAALLTHEYGDDARKQAKLIRALWKADDVDTLQALAHVEYGIAQLRSFHLSLGDIKRRMIDVILRTHGVERLGFYVSNGENVEYCNAGDTYASTILFIGNRLKVGCWGDMVENNLVRTGRAV